MTSVGSKKPIEPITVFIPKGLTPDKLLFDLKYGLVDIQNSLYLEKIIKQLEEKDHRDFMRRIIRLIIFADILQKKMNGELPPPE